MRYAPPAGADRVYVDDGNAHRNAKIEISIVGDSRFIVHDNADVEAGATHVGCDYIVES